MWGDFVKFSTKKNNFKINDGNILSIKKYYFLIFLVAKKFFFIFFYDFF